MSQSTMRWAIVIVAGLLLGLIGWWWVAPSTQRIETARVLSTPSMLASHCKDGVGAPRVEQVTEGVFVAIGFDLANTILVKTKAGNVVIDVSISPAAAQRVKAALHAVAPGPTRAIIYTHSHIDHIGGASVWVEEGTEIWATQAFPKHFFKQYGLFRPAEQIRGVRQFGLDVSFEEMACSGLGARPDLREVTKTGVRMPTRMFSGAARFQVGGVDFELIEAHGETHDQLFVYLPQKSALMPGDNYYRAFPNLYTIRGTSPRSVDAWIRSLDKMRSKDAQFLIPSHTVPVVGRAAVRTQLRDYRDGIQWVRDAVVRGANAGKSVDELAAGIGLPAHLRAQPALAELYGQIDWSVRAIYGNQLGWFDGRATQLYRLDARDEATRFVNLIGGSSALEAEARAAALSDPKWALRLVSLARDARLHTVDGGAWVSEVEARSSRALGEQIFNTNGRGYLLQRAQELNGAARALARPTFDDALIDAIPLSTLFTVMATRLVPERAADIEEAVRFELGAQTFTLTVRRGLAEVVEGEPLPDTPTVIATVKTTPAIWRRVALDVMSPMSAIGSGQFVIDGERAAFLTFILRFKRGF